MTPTVDEIPYSPELFGVLDLPGRAAHLESLYREFAWHGCKLPAMRLLWLFWRARTAWILRSRGFEFVKRVIDVVVSAVALLLLSPVFLVIAAAIGIFDGGNTLFWQKRVGRWGNVFAFPKFRSMKPNAEAMRSELMDKNHHGACVTFKIPEDPRVTPVGRILRRFSLDELPQLWCVFKGDMSLVGPRPALPHEVDRYSLEERRRLEVVPGLTCIWQVSGRADVPFPKQVEMDIDYIENRSVGHDLRLIARTIPTIVAGRGAY